MSAVTIGEDEKSAEFAHTFTVAAEQQQVLELLCRHSEEQVECYYVFSRKRALDPSLIRAVRRSIDPHVIIFASGCIVHRDQADALLDAGADYAVVGSALELADWRGAAERIFLARETVDCGQWQEKLVLSEPA